MPDWPPCSPASAPESRYRRFLSPKRELTPRELTFFTDIDHLNHEAIAAVDQRDGSFVGVARYVHVANQTGVAEVAIEVADAFQRMGIGTALAGLTIQHAHANGLTPLTATTLWENRAARGLLRHHGFRARRSRGHEIEHELKLEQSSPREAVCEPETPASDRAVSERPLCATDGGTTNSRITASDSPTANASPHHTNRKERPESPLPLPPTHAREARPTAPRSGRWSCATCAAHACLALRPRTLELFPVKHAYAGVLL